MSETESPIRPQDQAHSTAARSPRVSTIIGADDYDPFSFLGMHKDKETGELVVRVFNPDASGVTVVDRNTGKDTAQLVRAHDAGLFTGVVAKDGNPFAYRLRLTNESG